MDVHLCTVNYKVIIWSKCAYTRPVQIKPTTGNKTVISVLGVIVFTFLYLQRDTHKHTHTLQHKDLAFLSPHREH